LPPSLPRPPEFPGGFWFLKGPARFEIKKWRIERCAIFYFNAEKQGLRLDGGSTEPVFSIPGFPRPPGWARHLKIDE